MVYQQSSNSDQKDAGAVRKARNAMLQRILIPKGKFTFALGTLRRSMVLVETALGSKEAKSCKDLLCWRPIKLNQ